MGNSGPLELITASRESRGGELLLICLSISIQPAPALSQKPLFCITNITTPRFKLLSKPGIWCVLQLQIPSQIAPPPPSETCFINKLQRRAKNKLQLHLWEELEEFTNGNAVNSQWMAILSRSSVSAIEIRFP